MLFLLKDQRGKALVIAQAASRAEADEFGRAHVPDFCGESLELEAESCAQAEEFWGVRTLHVPNTGAQSGTTVVKTKVKAKTKAPDLETTHVWVQGLDLPKELIEEDFLTPEDHRDIALEHIERTCQFVVSFQVRKWARG